jgi:hypothetical protein
MRKLNDDRGSVLLLIIGMTALSLALIVGVMDATSLYLERKRLFTIADGAALVAAESFDPALGLLDGRPQLSDASVRAATNDYLRYLSPQARHGATLDATDTPDARTAVVTMRVLWHPSVISVFVPRGITLTVTARARTVY